MGISFVRCQNATAITSNKIQFQMNLLSFCLEIDETIYSATIQSRKSFLCQFQVNIPHLLVGEFSRAKVKMEKRLSITRQAFSVQESTFADDI